MRVSRATSRRTLIALASLSLGACGAERVVQLDDINDVPPSSAGRLEGVVTRANGAPAQGLAVSALNHGALIVTASTGGGGEFSMRFLYPISQQQPGDTLLTFFIQARTAVGGVSDRLVLREAVQVRMTRNVGVPVITNAVLRAAY